MSEIVVRNIFDDEISALCKAEGNESVDNVQYYERYLNWQKEGECAFLIALLDGKIAGYVLNYIQIIILALLIYIVIRFDRYTILMLE